MSERVYDFLFHTSDSHASGMGVVMAETEDDAREQVRQLVTEARQDVTITEIRIVPSRMTIEQFNASQHMNVADEFKEVSKKQEGTQS